MRPSSEEIKVKKIEIRDRGMCVCGSVRKRCVDRRSVPPVRPLEKSQVTAGGRRLCCSVNTSHGEGAHGVKWHISSSHFLCCGDRIRLRSDSLCSLQIFFKSRDGGTVVQMCCALCREIEGKCGKSPYLLGRSVEGLSAHLSLLYMHIYIYS